MRSRAVIGLALVFAPSAALAQTAKSPWSIADAIGVGDRLRLSGSIRLRYETIDGQARAGFNAADSLVNVRTTVFAEYDTGPLRIGGELYDSRVYGGNRGSPITTNEVNTFEPVQAYVAADIAEPFGKGSKATLQFGRFVLNLGSRRLVAADEYRNTTNGYTGLRADVSLKGGVKATAIYVLPQQRLPSGQDALLDNETELDRESFDAVLWGGLISKADVIGSTAAELSYFHFGERDAPGRPTADRSLETVGARLIRAPAAARFDHEIELFYQFGSASRNAAAASRPLDVSAWFIHAEAGYTLAHAWRPRISIEFDAASGDRPGGGNGRFDTLFGMRRAELAPSGLYNAVGRANLISPMLRIEATPGKRTDWLVSYRPLWLQSRFDAFSTTGVRDASGQSGRFAGHQIEARVRHWIVERALRGEVSGLVLAKGRFLETAPNAPRNVDTRYLSLNLTAEF